ncbi:MAG TPA: hypothetical protein V6C89_11795 [Drouetiella sp.]|jgi:YD repeat-containing protein
MPPSPSDSADRVHQTVSRIESDSKNGPLNAEQLHHELFELRKQDSSNGKVDKETFKNDLAAVTKQLHADGILPNLDIVETGDTHVAFRGVSTPGTSPVDGSASLVTKAHGTTFTYDAQNHVQSWTTKSGDTWKYDANDGKYHELQNGKETSKSTSDVVTVSGRGRETVTHADGSTTVTAPWGGTIERDASGLMTKETSGKFVKTFKYDGGQLSSMTVETDGKTVSYSKAADGKFYSSTDSDHKNPLDIAVDPKVEGSVRVTDKNGNTTAEGWGGTRVHWDKDQHLTSIDYHNGNKASDFSYDSNGQLTGFSMTGKDGKSHTYKSENGMVSFDGAAPVQGTLTASDAGRLLVTQTGDGSDSQFKSIAFNMGGSEVVSAKFGDKTMPTEITSDSGKISRFKYDQNGALTEIDARGYQLHKDNGQWLDGNNKPADVVPMVESNGTLSIIHGDGSFEQWTAGGVRTESIPDTPDAIAKEAKAVDDSIAATASGDSNSTANGDSQLASVKGDPTFAATICRDATIVARRMHSHGLCLKGVATALDMAGANNIHGGSAYMAADRLARDNQFQEIPESSKLQPGDIVVHGTTQTNPDGHILVYLGNGMEASDSIAPLTNMNYGSFTRVFRPVG